MSSSDRDRGSRLPEPLERRVLFAAGALQVPIGDGAVRSVSFIDGDGTAVTVSMHGGAASLDFTGNGLSQASRGRRTVITGTGVSLAAVAASGTSPRTTLRFKATGGDSRFTVVNITADGALRDIAAPQAVFTGTLSTAGPVRQVRLLRAENATITLGGGDGTSSVEITEAAVDTDLTSAGPIRRLTLGSWTGADGGDTIAAPSIGRVVVAGIFTGDMTLSSAGALDIRYLLNSTIAVSGNVGSASFDGLGGSSVYVGMRPLPPMAQAIDLSDFVAPSVIGRLRVKAMGWYTRSVISAYYIGRLSVGSLSNYGFGEHNIYANRIEYLEVRRQDHWGRLGRRMKYRGLSDRGIAFGALMVHAL